MEQLEERHERGGGSKTGGDMEEETQEEGEESNKRQFVRNSFLSFLCPPSPLLPLPSLIFLFLLHPDFSPPPSALIPSFFFLHSTHFFPVFINTSSSSFSKSPLFPLRFHFRKTLNLSARLADFIPLRLTENLRGSVSVHSL